MTILFRDLLTFSQEDIECTKSKVLLSCLYTVLQAKEIRSNHMKMPEKRLSKTFKIGL